MIETVLIPEDRIKIINKSVTDKLKESLNVTVSLEENAVLIDGEGLELFQAKNVVKAIGRGFSPVRAYRLMSDDVMLETIDLKGYGESRSSAIKSRIIGAGGKTREIIEECTKAAVSVYGRTISLIGTWEQIKNARVAVDMLINGAMHRSVYSFLEKIRG